MSTQFTNRQWRLPNNENKDKQSNYSMDFDGSSLIDLGDITMLNGVSQASYSFWFKLSSYTPASGSSSVMLVGSNAKGASCYIYNNNFYIHNFNTQYILVSSGVPSLNEWHHVCCVFNSGVAVAYLDGVSVGTVTEPTLTTTASDFGDNYNIGYSSFYSAYMNANGQIDGLSFFNYALSTSQITTLYGSSSTGIGNPMSLSPNPVAYYPLGDQDAFNGANYLVPNSSLKDYVFDFDGSNDYIDCGTGSRFYIDQITISAWVKLSSGLTSTQVIAGIRNTNAGSICYQLQNQASGKFRFVISQSNGTYVDSVANDVHQYNTWYNVVGVADGSNIKLYINGDLQTIVNSYDGTIYSPNENFNIGRQSSPSNYYWDGKLSNAQIFNTALSATGSNSVETLYNNGSPLTSMSGFTSLQGWWKLDASATYDSSTTTWTIEDSSTNSNDGTSYGMNQANLVVSDLSFKTSYSPYALDFDGADDYLDANRTIASNLDFSVSAWINPTSYATVMLGTRNLSSVSTSNGFTMNINSSGNLWGRIFTETSNIIQVQTGSTISLNNWSHVAMTYNSSSKTLKTYLNGSEVGSIIGTDSSVTSTAELNIGRASIGTFYDYFVGKLSNVSIFNTELTSTQVTEIYNQGVPSNLHNFSGTAPVSWWQLGSNSSFNTNWTCLDEIGTNNAVSANMTNSDIVDGVNSYANGLSSGMGGDEVIGSAPFSDANSLSVNMDVLDRVTDTPS